MADESLSLRRKWEKHARCALLPSPEKLDESIGSPGTDETDTLEDFERVKDWVTKAQLLNTDFYGKKKPKKVGTDGFDNLITLAFSTAYAAMHNTFSPELPELLFWYYAGHGLGKETAKKLDYSSTPCLSRVSLYPKYNDAANEFVKENRKVKGGELFLHRVGFCDLYGLLKPWIAAVKAESDNAKGAIKENKHLVIILDSCHSGIIAEELDVFKEQAQGIDSTLLDGNSVTIQAACGPDERTFGGYFTPCFVYLNENKKFLDELKDEWKNMGEEEKANYRSIYLPSPMVVTTRPQSQDVTMELPEVQNFKLTLFQDPGFFKFCSIKVYQRQDKELFVGKERVLSAASANAFMSTTTNFTVLDYKLKTYQTGPYAGTPMGLFLLEDPLNPTMTVCAHIHFPAGNTKIYTRINLVHHKKPPMGSTLFIHEEDHVGLSPAQIASGQHKIQVPLDGNAKNLVQTCYQYAKSKEPGRWENASRWNMKGSQYGVNGMFRLACQQERSAWEDSYLENIEKFDLPKVA